MNNNDNYRKESIDDKKDTFDVVIIGSFDKQETLFSKTFPILLNNSNIMHKYLNKFDLSLRERIILPKDFINNFHPEILDKLGNIDILILTYNIKENITFEYLKTFYYLYYQKLEENDRPKTIIIIERDYTPKDGVTEVDAVKPNAGKELANLFNGHFCDYETDEVKLTIVLNECVDQLIKIYYYNIDYIYFKYKELDKEINCFVFLYGDKQSQDIVIKKLLESKSNNEYKKTDECSYEIKHEIKKDNIKYSFKIKLKIMSIDDYNDGECNILLYDINKNESCNLIKNLIREIVVKNDSKLKKIYNLFSLNFDLTPISANENNDKIKEGKMLAYELGANFSNFNVNNNSNLTEEIKNKCEDILIQIIDCINISKNITDKQEVNHKEKEDNFVVLENYDATNLFINKINNKIKKDLNNNDSCLFNLCPTCYGQLNIKINEKSNIIMLYCDKCKNEPKGVNIEQFEENNKISNINFHCRKCKNSYFYGFKNNKLSCCCELILTEQNARNRSRTERIENNIPIPVFLKECYCDKHNKFNQYYLKYSKQSICEVCSKEKKKKNCFVEEFKEVDINDLIKKSREELKKEDEFLSSLQKKINECINSLKIKFEKYMLNKRKIHKLKTELINSLHILHNNNTIISNVKSLKFDDGKNFKYNEDDSLENKLKNLNEYFNYESDINNLYIGNKQNEIIQINGPYDILTQNEKNIKVTDVCELKNNQFICISFNDGKAKIYDSNKLSSNNYPECVITEFNPNQGINSLYVSKSENNIWKELNSNNNEIIYLNGYEEIKIIQMNANYTKYEKIYSIKNEFNNILYSIEIDYNRILSLTYTNNLYLIHLYKEQNKIKDEKKEINNLLINPGKSPLSLKKISKNIIYLDLVNSKDIEIPLAENNGRFTLFDENENNQKEGDDDDPLKSFTLKEDYLDDDNNDNNDNNESSNEENNLYNKKNIPTKKIEQSIGLFSLNLNNDTIRENKNWLDIKKEKEYILPSYYGLLGVLSEEKNLLLLCYKKEKSNNFPFIFIFDLNIGQYINALRFHNVWCDPQYFIKWNYKNITDKHGFIIIDEDFNLIQYLYDENYPQKFYYINKLKKDHKIGSPDKILSSDNKIIMLSKTSNYYIINN